MVRGMTTSYAFWFVDDRYGHVEVGDVVGKYTFKSPICEWYISGG